MNAVVLSAVFAVALAAPQYNNQPEPQPQLQPSYNLPVSATTRQQESFNVIEVVPILRDDRVMEEDGRYNLDVETGNGIILSQSGSPDGPDGSVIKAGSYSYTAPDGTFVEMKFVADENGFQPESPFLPVAPEFPHPIPQFVLDQIAFAEQEDAAHAQAEVAGVRGASSDSAPSYSYNTPQ